MLNIFTANYNTSYSYKLAGIGNEEFVGSACFSSLYRKVNFSGLDKFNGSIYIFVNKSIEFANMNNARNYSFLTRNEENSYLRLLNKLSESISYSKVKTPFYIEDAKEHICIRIKLKNASEWEVKMAPVLVRNMYENPFSYQLKIAFLSKKVSALKKLDFIGRLCLAIRLSPENNFIHSNYEGRVNIISENEYIARYNSLKNNGKSINSFHPSMDVRSEHKIKFNHIKENIGKLINNELPSEIVRLLIKNNN